MTHNAVAMRLRSKGTLNKLSYRLFTLCFVCLTSITALAQDETASTLHKMPASALPQDEVIWLDATSGKFMSLQREHLSKTRRGIAILLPDIAMSPINPDYIEPLRHSLNHVGWATLSIEPPPQSLLNEAASEEQSAYAKALIERVNSAIAWGKKNNRYSVLIAQGRQMAYLIEAQVQQHLQPVNAVILLNAQPAYTQASEELKLRYPDNQQQLSQQLTALALPILDINQTNRSESTAHLQLRDGLAKRQQHKSYRQIRYLARKNYAPATKSIYGWLTSIGLK